MAWSWMGGVSEWIIPLLNVPIPLRQESTWADLHTMVVVVVVVVVAAAEGEESHIMTAAMIATTDMTSTTTDIVAGALHHRTTVDTGLAHGLAPTAHAVTELLLSTFSIPPITDGCVCLRVVHQSVSEGNILIKHVYISRTLEF